MAQQKFPIIQDTSGKSFESHEQSDSLDLNPKL